MPLRMMTEARATAPATLGWKSAPFESCTQWSGHRVCGHIHVDAGERILAVSAGEGLVLVRVIVLRENDGRAAHEHRQRQEVDVVHDAVATRDGERAAFAEIILRVDDDESVSGSNCKLCR
jgi:hypothetical protein